MPGYITEGIKYFRIANSHRALVSSDSQNAFVSIVFSAMYIESVVNEIIFHDQLIARLLEEDLGRTAKSIEMEIYNEMKSFECKIKIILDHYNIIGFDQDKEFIELSHLITLRGCLVHLKPVEQKQSGEPERKICRAA